ncbi:MAG: AraC family transcriptional regulator [Erythrobacter sp.]|uniref:helix-turn-helix domain-containing protein n=1 Tax=Erythrobacter sp. TaxID=1042 RepID=UPI002636A8E9|nr:AraC family transcriptional regulator [Erythrobacter sp.]MDJ0979526.1 AraC family transcriptional regulator [Erythrobacter sp.]
MGEFQGSFTPPRGARAGGRYTVRSQFFTPPEIFEGCFTTFYHMTLDVADGGAVTDYLQPEWGNIRFFAGSAPTARIGASRVSGARFGATGPSSLPCQFELASARMWGIGFLPLGWARFVDAPAYDLANLVCDGAAHPAFAKFDTLTPVLTDPDATQEEQLAHLTETLGALMRTCRDEPKIRRVHESIVSGDHATVADLASECAMSVRTLERLCRRYFGFTPKLLMRRQRFMRSLTSFMLRDARSARSHAGLEKRPARRWTEAMDAEYHDQAQFTREFREFMTMLPSDYAALDHPILASFMEARARIWGSAAQTLDPPCNGCETNPVD